MNDRYRAVVLGVFIGLFSLSLPAVVPAVDDGGSEYVGDDNLEILVSTLRANRKAFVAANLPLSEDEAKAFWPVYDRYQADLNVVNDRLVAIIGEYSANFGTIGDEAAVALADDYLTAERDRAEVRRRYLKAVSATIPGRKVVRFYQIENKIDALLRVDLAATIPVIDEIERLP